MVCTFTISEPSISFNFERQPAILSGWVLHFRRSSISPAKTNCKIKAGTKAGFQIIHSAIAAHSAKLSFNKTKENISRFAIIYNQSQTNNFPFQALIASLIET